MDATVETPATSTPANESEAPSPSERLASLTPAEYDTWRMKGTLPEPPKTEESAPPTGAAPPDKGEVAAEAAPASEPAKSQEPKAGEKPKNAETRIQELLADRKRERERAERAEARNRELEAAGKPADAKLAESSPATPAARPEPKPEDLDAQGQPKYATYEDYLKDVRGWDREQLKAELKAESERERAAADKSAREAEAATVRQKQERSLAATHDQGKKRHADYQQHVFGDASPLALIPENSPMDAYLIEAIIEDAGKGAELLYHLATKAGEVERIAALQGKAQDRAMHDLATSLSSKAPTKTVSTASAPPSAVGGTAITPKDPVAAAAKDGNFEAYKQAADAEDQKRFALGRKG